MGQTPTLLLPYPDIDDSADVPRDVKALADALDAQSLAPPGVIQMWPGGAAPTGWFLCNGQTVTAAANPKLAALFGQSGGNVTLPNLAGRTLVGAKASGTPTDPARPLRSTGGAAVVTLSAAQSGLASHDHDIQTGGELVAFGPNTYSGKIQKNSGTSAGRSQNAGGTAASQAHENMPLYYAINFIIRGG